MRYMMCMDIKRILKVLVVTIASLFLLSACGQTASSDMTREIPENIDEDVSESEYTEELEELDVPYTINNTVDEVINRAENAMDGDRLGRIDNREIYIFKCPDLTNKSFFYSESGVLVRYDNYLCVKYDPEKSNEDYILLVYYFDSNNKWEAWYKYSVAKNINDAELIASQERDNGYTVWVSDNIVMQGEQFSEANISEKEFMTSFQNEKIYMNK